MRLILETPRLALRELTEGDLDFIAELLAHPEVMRFWPRPHTREEAAEWIRRVRARYARDGFSHWLAIEKSTARPIGQVGLLAQTVNGTAEIEIGYIIHRPFWRMGFASEAAAGCRDHAFHALGRTRVISLCHPENVGSQAVARRIGFQPEGEAWHAGSRHIVFAGTRAARADSPA